MEAQEIFNTAYVGLLEQGCISSNGRSCLYRGPNDTKCAIGILIDDETAKTWDKRGDTIYDTLKTMSDRHPYVWMKPFQTLLAEMQLAHDSFKIGNSEVFRSHIKKEFQQIAEEFNLQVPEVV